MARLLRMSVTRFPSKCNTYFNRISRKSAKKMLNECLFPSANFMWLLGVVSSGWGGANTPAGVIKLLQKKRTQWDNVNKRAPGKPQKMENHMENYLKFKTVYLLMLFRIRIFIHLLHWTNNVIIYHVEFIMLRMTGFKLESYTFLIISLMCPLL